MRSPSIGAARSEGCQGDERSRRVAIAARTRQDLLTIAGSDASESTGAGRRVATLGIR